MSKDSAPLNRLETLRQDYLELEPLANRFCSEIVNQLGRLLEDRKIALGFPIQQRVKSWDSISEKLTRLPHSIKDIKKLQDLVGLRVVLLFRRDASQVCTLINESFRVIRQYNPEDRLKEDQFGYSSTHFVIELPSEWLAVPTLSRFSGLRAEVQVRTVAQHMWAAASHTLQYKQETNVPTVVLRSIHRVSALLETVDLEFERVLTERELYRTELDLSQLRSTLNSNTALNVDLLEKLLDDLLPPENKDTEEPFSQLLSDLNHFKVSTTQLLQKLLERHKDYIERQETEMVAQERQNLQLGGNYRDDIDDVEERLNRGVFYTFVGLTRKALEGEFGGEWKAYISDSADEEVPF
jgi:putative GTP pyrophosphokinase